MVWQGKKGKGVEEHLTSDLFVRVVYFWLRMLMRDPSWKLQETIITSLRDGRRSTYCIVSKAGQHTFREPVDRRCDIIEVFNARFKSSYQLI